MTPSPADSWPDGPLTETDARSIVDSQETERERVPATNSAVFGVWGQTHSVAGRPIATDEEPSSEAVVDVVLETSADYRMYSYTRHDGATQWVAYEPEEKGTEGADVIENTLSRYELLAGESELQ